MSSESKSIDVSAKLQSRNGLYTSLQKGLGVPTPILVEPHIEYSNQVNTPHTLTFKEVVSELLYALNFIKTPANTLLALNFCCYLSTAMIFVIFVLSHLSLNCLFFTRICIIFLWTALQLRPVSSPLLPFSLDSGLNWRGHGGNSRHIKKPGWECDHKSSPSIGAFTAILPQNGMTIITRIQLRQTTDFCPDKSTSPFT